MMANQLAFFLEEHYYYYSFIVFITRSVLFCIFYFVFLCTVNVQFLILRLDNIKCGPGRM